MVPSMGTKPELFGTDGIRGVAGRYPLDQSTLLKLGSALGTVLRNSSRPVRVVLGKDTRESNEWISRALAAGLAATGAAVVDSGIITTPGVAFLTRQHAFSAGVMVSASHNPYQDNGIKLLSNAGTKLPESLELEIEGLLDSFTTMSAAGSSESVLEPAAQLLEDYVGFLAELASPSQRLSNIRVVADFANGSATRVVPPLLKRLGIQSRALNSTPTGRNINLDCGSLHPETMADETKASSADLGVAFDGDADRAIFSLPDGRIADGDHVLYAAATSLHEHGKLKGNSVVGTLMTNLGLEVALGQHGIGLKRTPVGDKYVLEEMLRSGINLGGEPSGHIIFSDISLAGDGIITLLQVLRLLDETGKSLTELVKPLKQFPQIIRNVRVRERIPLDSFPEVNHAVSEFRREAGDRGRVVVRYSGTEPLARVMVEAQEAELVERHAGLIAGAIELVLGAGK